MPSQGGPESEPALSLRITHITTTMAPPLPSLRSLYVPSTLPTAVPAGLNPHLMPVIRIFGTTTAQQKICANVHMCYPYFYVPFPMDSIDPLRPERVVKLCQRFAVSLNHALCLALRQNPDGKSAAANFAGGTDTKHLHVVSVLLVKGIPFYGYHIGYSYFLRVTLANPKRIYLAMEQLRKPVVLGREWQPHEAHLSHVLQFMCDFDLYGCGMLNLSGGKFRGPLPKDNEESSQPGRITESTVPAHMLYPAGTEPSKDTHSTLEIDILPHQILNRYRLQERPLHHDFIELLHQPLHPEEKLVPAMKELWEDERRRRMAKGLGTSEVAMLPVSGGGRGRTMEELGYKVEGKEFNNRGGDWKISEELWELLQDRMDVEKKRRGTLAFERVSRDLANGKEGERRVYDKWIMTTFEAVTSHWPKRARTQRTQRSVRSVATVRGFSSPTAPPSSSPPPTSPVPYDDDEEANPFEIAATQAVSQGAPLEAEVDADAVTSEVSEDQDTNDEQVLHEETVRLHTRQSQHFRATQRVIDEFELDDQALDELFRQTVPAGSITPKRERYSTPARAPSSTIKKESRARLAAEQAGFVDLNAIELSSSFGLSSPANPYAAPQTPTRQKSAPAAQVTLPSSLVRNIFARSRSSISASPIQSPSKNRISPNTVMLPQPKRSFARLSPTPQPSSQAPHASSSPLIRSQRPIQVLSEIKAERSEMVAPPRPNGQATPALPKQTKPALTPTFVDPDVFGSTPITRSKKRATISTASDSGSTPATSTRSRKRVKISSAEDPASQDLPPRDPSQVIQSNSTTAETSVQSSGSKVGLSSTAWVFRDPPPSSRAIADTMEENGVDSVEYQDPFYSNPADVPLRPKLFAGRVFNVKGNSVADLKDFQASIATPRPWLKSRRFLPATARHGWEYGPPPPSRREVLTYFGQDKTRPTQALKRKSQLAAPTQKNKYGYKLSQKKPQREGRSMSVLCLEVFAPSRGQLLPDPEKDEIEAIFYCFQNDDEELIDSTIHPGYHAGYVIIDGPQTTSRRAKLDGIPVTYVESELDLVNWVIDTTREWDPDVLTGWELHNSSWGYVSARADKAFSMDLMNEISRMVGGGGFNRKDGYSAHHTSTFKVEGRHVLNIWRILRSEVTLNQYTFENAVFHVLHQRIPRYSAGNLTALWRSKTPGHTALVLRYMFQRVVIYAELLDSAEIVSKNAEFARVFGVDFDAVIFRGSQFKVESFIFRLAKPESFVMVSPSKQQVGLQNAPFATPLIAEPESKYYNHPIVVLDFQSLYPSVMIAYNICYSTCLGRVEKFKGTDKFGFTELKVADGMIELLKDYLTVTPNGMIFVKPAVRKSLLAKMLGEVLDTRVMVKNAMKGTKDKSLTQMLNARQLGLKLMANVTYGYTSATFSGRMPCIEIADSIVQTGRETLEKAQELIHSRADWNATVVYGDTDSLFISLPGRSKEQAFKIGHDIADTVTAMNPKPVKLKFEKVYMGSVLMAKKRYVGFKYEHPDETEPVFDAKGIETIRRDGFPAQQKMEEVCLKMLFRNQDLSEIKEFCRQEWTKILQGRVSPQDFIIAKEVRLGTYSEKGIPPPGAAVAYRRILKDPRDEPQYAERVPYVISNAEGRRLIDRARMPEEMLANRSLGIDAEYYIRNLLIPPLARIFNLVGADVEQWYDSMPRQKRAGKYGALGGMRIDSHFLSAHCLVCGGEGGEVCDECRESPTESAVTLLRAEHDAQARVLDLQRICASCSGTPAGERLLCDSVDCPVMYTRVAAERDAQDASRARELVGQLDW